MFEGIDVSKHQGVIDWNRVKASGKKFAIIRLGWTHYTGGLTLDPLFVDNHKGATAAGLEVGIYVYSYDRTPQAAALSAKAVLEAVKNYRLTYPIAFDIEDTYNTGLSKQMNADIVCAFLEPIERAKYYGLLYTYTSFAESFLDLSAVAKYDVWIADYREKCGYKGSYGIWQHKGDKGRCDGVNGACDLNTSYKDYRAIIQGAGLNQSKPEVPKPPEQSPDYAKLYAEAKAESGRLKAQLAMVKDALKELLGKLE